MLLQLEANQDGNKIQNTFINPTKLSFIYNVVPKGIGINCMIRTSDGGSLVSGFKDATRQVVTKLSSKGVTQWEQTIGSDTAAWITRLVEVLEQGYEIIGYTDFAAGPLMPKCRYVVRLKPSGEIIRAWEPRKGTKNVNRGSLNPIIRCRDGSYVTISAYLNTTDSRIIPYFWRYDYNGNLAGEVIYDTVSLSSFYMTSFFQTKDRGFGALVVGWDDAGNLSKSKMQLWRLDTTGKKIWSKDVCSWNASITYPLYSSMIQTADSGFAIATVDNVTENDTLHTILYKYDSDGNLLFKSKYALSTFNAPYALGETPSGNLLIGGFVQNGAIMQNNNSSNIDTKSTDYLVFKTKSNGELLWKDSFGDSNSGDRVKELVVLDEHTFLISGFTNALNDSVSTSESVAMKVSDLVSDVNEESLSSDDFQISPNPVSNIFTISGIEGISTVIIVNSIGMEVSRTLVVVSGKQEVDVSDLASGIYFVQMRTATGMITKPIVVQR